MSDKTWRAIAGGVAFALTSFGVWLGFILFVSGGVARMLRDIASRLPQGDDDTDEPVADTPAPDPRPGTSGKATTSPSRPAAATGPETSSKATTRASPPAPRRGDGDPAVLAALLAQVLEAQAKHAAHGRQPADTPPAKSPGSTTREPGTSAGRPDDGDAATGGQPRAGGPR